MVRKVEINKNLYAVIFKSGTEFSCEFFGTEQAADNRIVEINQP